MSALVLDASVTVEYLRWTRCGERVATRIGQPGLLLHAPHLSSVEVISALRGLVLGRLMDATDAARAVTDLAGLAVERRAVEIMIDRVWALRGNLTACDATYVALAESLGCPLLTADAKFDTVTVRRLTAVEVIS